jgi:hypothetical protein
MFGAVHGALLRVVFERHIVNYTNFDREAVTSNSPASRARGLEPGPKFKEIFTRLRAAWLDGEVGSEEEEVKLLGTLL